MLNCQRVDGFCLWDRGVTIIVGMCNIYIYMSQCPKIWLINPKQNLKCTTNNMHVFRHIESIILGIRANVRRWAGEVSAQQLECVSTAMWCPPQWHAGPRCVCNGKDCLRCNPSLVGCPSYNHWIGMAEVPSLLQTMPTSRGKRDLQL